MSLEIDDGTGFTSSSTGGCTSFDAASLLAKRSALGESELSTLAFLTGDADKQTDWHSCFRLAKEAPLLRVFLSDVEIRTCLEPVVPGRTFYFYYLDVIGITFWY